MHNLHLIVVRADTALEAAEEVRSSIAEWGNDNNWRSIGGIASEDGMDDVANLENSCWGLSFLDNNKKSESETYFQSAVRFHQKMLRMPIISRYYPHQEYSDFSTAIKSVANELQMFDCNNGVEHALWAASQNLKHFYELFSANKVLDAGQELSEFYGWEFDQEGLTDMTANSDGRQRYIIFLDMHS